MMQGCPVPGGCMIYLSIVKPAPLVNINQREQGLKLYMDFLIPLLGHA